MRRVLSNRRGLAVEIAGGLAAIGFLWAYTATSNSPYITPLPTVLRVFQQTWLFADFGSDLLPSLERLAAGYALAAIVGIGAGLVLAQSRVLRMAVDPIMNFLRATPPPALLPLFIVVIGIGPVMKIVVVFFVCVWPIMLNTTDGLDGLDPTLLETVRSYEIRGLDRMRLVILPAIAPRVCAGLRISLSLAVLILIVAEMLGSSNGIGYFVLQAQQSFAIPQMWAGTLLLGLLGYVLNAGFGVFERRTLRWHVSQRTES
ncbi:MAG TPA: ABC transporter permease [Solirubrobacteraceae bacterium]|jgi:ABC-type nitrate/sulfonate/bicarbonate transport system permease component|nr:ABC transporter permease [Solirubrobacteraceae bacterium]